MNLLVSDYDGTLFTNENDILINCRTIEEFIKKGNKFLLSSGRPYDSLKRQVEKYKIPYSYLGTSDGNFMFDSNDNLIMENYMSKKIVRDLEELKKLNIYERIQYAYPNTNSEEYKKDSLGSIAFVIKEDKITSDFTNEYNRLKQENPKYQFDIYGYGDTYYYMIRPMGINKSSPIIHLEKKLNIPKRKIYTIGDNDNDIEMIKDYNGFMIGNNFELKNVSLKRYDAVHELINDINKKKVLKRW